MSGTLLDTGLRDPGGPKIILSPEAESVLIQHDLDRDLVDAPLRQWWYARIEGVKYDFVDGRATTEGAIAATLCSDEEHLDFEHDDDGHAAHGSLTFSCIAHPGMGATFYVRGEMYVFLRNLRPTIHVETLEYLYHAPTVCSVYLSNPSPTEIASAKEFFSALGDHLDSFVAEGPDEQTASWFQWLRWRTNSQMTEERAQEKRVSALNAVKAPFTKPAAATEHHDPEFVTHLLGAIGNDNAIVLLHNLLLIRRQAENGSADILIQTLSDDEVAELESSPDLLKGPIELFSLLHERHPESVLWREAMLFYSYSHKDGTLRDKLETHLSMLKRGKYINQWHDRKIAAGTEWKGQIDERLDAADVILLLISADFLASDYCYDIEMQRAMERHKTADCRVVPVILRACDWSDAPFAELQALPTDAKPVTSWSNTDEAFADVAKGIRATVRALPQLRKELTSA